MKPKRVLFLCVHNSARSQMAESFARTLAPEGSEIWSAGTEPSQVHPLAIQVMREAGFDLSTHRSKHLDDTPWRDVDIIVSLCSEAEDLCPVVDSTVRRIHWPLDDPSAEHEAVRLQAFRDTRDELRWRIASLWPTGD